MSDAESPVERPKCHMCSENEGDVILTTTVTALSPKGERIAENVDQTKAPVCIECLMRLGVIAEEHFEDNTIGEEPS
ncbi:hypothetical protein LCGC14_2953190 [marine sediment metagenome]|uniref:Uncharacterized protein n=1 Tax=marine sediment metagenome TaxID=412755 RepID=A0A0F8ZM98_9ZZZZ